MALQKTNEKDAVALMSDKEKQVWKKSLCKDCAYFNGFFTEENYPTYFNCQAHNTTGVDFVANMFSHHCFFYKSKE